MSYALSVYLISQNQLLRFPGCADERLLRDCLTAARERLADLDYQLYDEDEEDDITHEQAFRELFSGNFTAEYCGARYGWAFETLCDCLGTSLSNRGFSPCDIDWYEELDDLLAASDITLRFDSLTNDCPINIPLSDDWPMIGHWKHSEIVEAAPLISRLAKSVTDPDVAEAIATIHEWINQATKDADLIIVGFHG